MTGHDIFTRLEAFPAGWLAGWLACLAGWFRNPHPPSPLRKNSHPSEAGEQPARNGRRPCEGGRPRGDHFPRCSDNSQKGHVWRLFCLGSHCLTFSSTLSDYLRLRDGRSLRENKLSHMFGYLVSFPLEFSRMKVRLSSVALRPESEFLSLALVSPGMAWHGTRAHGDESHAEVGATSSSHAAIFSSGRFSFRLLGCYPPRTSVARS